MSEIKKFVTTVVSSIVDDVSSIKIDEIKTDSGFMYEITVGKDDVGKLIGKKGRVASALRVLASSAGAKNGVRVLINVMNKPLGE